MMRILLLFSLLLFSCQPNPAGPGGQSNVQGRKTYPLMNLNWTASDDGYSKMNISRPSSSNGLTNPTLVFQASTYAGQTYPYAYVSGSLPSGTASSFDGIRFYAKSSGKGSWLLCLPTTETATSYNHYRSVITESGERRLYELPFRLFTQPWGDPKPWITGHILSVQFYFSGNPGFQSELQVDSIQFYQAGDTILTQTSNPVILEPKINQVGYLPDSPKLFSVVTQSARVRDTFYLKDSSDTICYTNTIAGPVLDNTQDAGEMVLQGDFSSFNQSGSYYIEVNGLKSHTFQIQPNIYDSLFHDTLRVFYLVRCGTAIDDPVTGLKHPACHTADGRLRENPSQSIDAAGGWHNAGDLGKWMHMEAISAAYMLWLYQLKSPAYQTLNNHIPESGNGVSDLLNEARWGLEWMLKLQRSDGSVYHKVDTEPGFCYGTPPDEDPFTRYVSLQGADGPNTPSSVDAGDFVGTMIRAYRVFAAVSPDFASKCLSAAQKTWTWLAANHTTGQSDIYYTDTDPSQEYFWAKAEMASLTHDSNLIKEIRQDMNTIQAQDNSWMFPQNFGFLALGMETNFDAGIQSKAKQLMVQYCQSQSALSEKSGYGVSLAASDYFFSNSHLVNKAATFLFTYAMTGDQSYRNLALSQLDYLLGRNSLDQVFITGYGSRRFLHPYHWAFADYGIVIPGLSSSGPCAITYDVPMLTGDWYITSMIQAGTPPAKCFADVGFYNGSSGMCEGQTSDWAALAFLEGYFLN